MDWHAQIHPNDRRAVMQKVAQALRQAQPNYAPQQIAQVAQNFERHLHSTATSKEDYFITCRNRLQTMEQKARVGAMNVGMPTQTGQLPNAQAQQYDQQQASAQAQQVNMQALMAQRAQLQTPLQTPQTNANLPMAQQVDPRTMLMQQQQSMLQRGLQQSTNLAGQQQKPPMSTLNQPVGNLTSSPYQQQQQQQQQHTATNSMVPQAVPNLQRPANFQNPNPPMSNQASQQGAGLSISNPNGVPSAAQMQQIERMCQMVESYRAHVGAPPLEASDRTPQRVMELYKAMKAHETRLIQERRQAQATQAGQTQNVPISNTNPNAGVQFQQTAQPQVQRPVPQVPPNSQNSLTLAQMRQMQANLRSQMHSQNGSAQPQAQTQIQQPQQQQQQQQMQQMQIQQQQQQQHQLQQQQQQQQQQQFQQQQQQQQQMQIQMQQQQQQQMMQQQLRLQQQQQQIPASHPIVPATQAQRRVQGQGIQQPATQNGQTRTDANNPFNHPIPAPLLAKLSFLPAGITSWYGIMELGKKKLLNPQQVDMVRQLYNIHQKLLQSQAQQMQQHNRMPQQQLQQQTMSQMPMPQPPRAAQVPSQNQQGLIPADPALTNMSNNFGPVGQQPPANSYLSVHNQQNYPGPKRKSDAVTNQQPVQDVQGSPTKRRKAPETAQAAVAGANVMPQAPMGAQPGVEKGQMMQLLLSSCPLEEQARLRTEVAQMEEQISSRKRNHIFKELSEEEKTEVRKQVTTMAPYCTRVDQLTTIYYMVSKNVQATRQLLEMKYLFRDHLNWIPQGRFVLNVNDLMKLKGNCDKMFASVKEHLTAVARAVQAKAHGSNSSTSPTAEALAPAFNKGLKPEDLKLPPGRKKPQPSKDASGSKNTPEQQALRIKQEQAKIAAQAEALIKKEAEADPLAWAVKQVEAFYITSPVKPTPAAQKTTGTTPSTILRTPLPFVAANTPNTVAKHLISANVSNSMLPPTPPRSDRITTRVLGDDVLDDGSGLFELFMNDMDETLVEPKARSGVELLGDISMDDGIAHWGMPIGV